MTRRRKMRIIRTTIICVVLGALALWGLIYASRQYQAGRFEPQWRQLCDAYIRWYKPFDRADQSEEMTALLDRMKRDPYLADNFIKPLEDASAAGILFDPRALGEPLPYDQQAAHPPHGIETKQKVLQALAQLDKLQQALDVARWPAAANVAQARAEFQKRGWTTAASALDQNLADLNLAAQPHLERAIPAILDAQQPLAKVQAQWQEITRLESQIKSKAPRDKILARFSDYALKLPAGRAEPGADPLIALAHRLAEVKTTGDQLLQVLASPEYAAADLQAFYAQSLVQRTGDKMPEADAFDLWIKELPRYGKFTDPDPRPAWKIDDALSKVKTNLASLETLAQANPRLPQSPKSLAQRLALATQKIADLRQRTWDRSNKLAIESGISQVDQEIAQLALATTGTLADAQNWIRDQELASKATFAENLSALKERKPALSSPALLAVWDKSRTAILSRVKDNDLPSLKSAARDLDQTKTTLEKLAADLPQALDLPAKQDWNAKVAPLLRNLADRRREEALSAAAEQLKFTDGIPTTGADFGAAWQKLRTAHVQWAASAQAFVEAYNRIDDLLALGYGLNDPLDDGKSTIAQLAQPFSAFTSDKQIMAACAQVLAPLDELNRIEASTNRSELENLASRSDRPASARAAWKRLHSRQLGFPSTAADLATELSIQRNLRALVRLVEEKDKPRAKVMLDEIAASGPLSLAHILCASAEPAAVDQAMKAAIEAKAELGLPGDAGRLTPAELDKLPLTPQARFNCFLYSARVSAQALKAAPDPAARQQVQQILAELPRELPEGVKLPQLLQPLLKPESTTTDTPGEAGPLAADKPIAFKAISPTRKDSLSFEWNGLSLRFVLIENATVDGKRLAPYYICSSELPLRLVREVFQTIAKSPAEMGLPTEPSQYSPHSWRISARGLDVSAGWIAPISQKLGGTFDPALASSQTPDRLKDPQLNPSLRMPMQQLPPESAMSIAAVLGCRLPTTAEWKAAAAMQKHAPNLRDAAWELQRNHIAQLSKQRLEVPWPDSGCFVPPGVHVAEGGKAAAWSTSQLRALGLPTDQASGETPNDGALYFRPTDALEGERVCDLVGNVAEFVWDDPAPLLKLPDHKLATFKALLDQQPQMIGVVGGSAISPPEIGIERQKIDPDRLHEAWADVGLRLAFSPAKRTVADRLREILEEQPYLK